MIIEKKKISELKPAPYNPRKSTPEQEQSLKISLEKFGVVEPVIFNKQTGHIVGGHFRVRELKKLGHKEVDCVIVDLTLEQERELNIRLNANTGAWDMDMLASEFDKMELEEWGLVVEWPAEEQQQKDLSNNLNETFEVVVTCINETEQEQIYNKLIGEGYECRVLTL